MNPSPTSHLSLHLRRSNLTSYPPSLSSRPIPLHRLGLRRIFAVVSPPSKCRKERVDPLAPRRMRVDLLAPCLYVGEQLAHVHQSQDKARTGRARADRALLAPLASSTPATHSHHSRHWLYSDHSLQSHHLHHYTTRFTRTTCSTCTARTTRSTRTTRSMPCSMPEAYPANEGATGASRSHLLYLRLSKIERTEEINSSYLRRHHSSKRHHTSNVATSMNSPYLRRR